MWRYTDSDELYHHGIVGMKWGIRRYQNKDGSLTAAGRRRAAKLEKEYTSLTGRKPGNKDNVKRSKNRSVKDMTNEELREQTNRMTLENNYIDAQNRSARLNPKHVSLGRRFISHIGGQVIVPGATEAGKNLVSDFLTRKGKELLYGNKKNK